MRHDQSLVIFRPQIAVLRVKIIALLEVFIHNIKCLAWSDPLPLILIVVILTQAPRFSYAFRGPTSMPTSERLETVNTDHFRIVFQKPLEPAVPYLVEQCEEAYQTLTSIFQWYPQNRIEVLFIDAFDTHNGWATVMPHNKICIYASGAEPGSSIFQPGNYLARTIYHELTHVMTMDMRYGYNRVFSGLFGKMLPLTDDLLSPLLFFLSASPVSLAPEWYLEGLAIWAETEFAPPGRGRSSMADMIFRCAVQENSLLPYRRWDFGLPDWPYGLAAYLYGLKTIQYIAEYESPAAQTGPMRDGFHQNVQHAAEYEPLSAQAGTVRDGLQPKIQHAAEYEPPAAQTGTGRDGFHQKIQHAAEYESPSAGETGGNTIGNLAQSLAQAFMFNFDSHSKEVTGRRFESLVQEMLRHERWIQQENLGKLRILEPTETPRLTRPGIIVYQPVLAGNRIYVAAQEEGSRDSLYRYIPEEKRMEKLAEVRLTADCSSLSASTDSRFIYYTRLEVLHRDNYWYEVRRFDTENQTDTLVTDEGRYRSIDLSPDGQNLVAVSMRGGKSFLVETALSGAGDGRQEKILASTAHRIQNKLHDGQGCGRQEKILVSAALQTDFSSPRYSPDGSRIAYISGDEHGFSLLLFDRQKGTSQLVYHSPHQMLFPAWCRGKESIVFSSDQNGVYNLYEIPISGQGEPIPLTHVLGGLFAPAFTPDGRTIAAVAYDSAGYYLTMIPYEPQRLAGQNLPAIGGSRWKGQEGEGEVRRPDPNTAKIGSGIRPRSYSSLRHIHFDYWGPWLTVSGQGVESGLGAVFSDPADYQNLRLLGGVESGYGTGIGALQYTYQGLWPTLHLYVSRDQQVYPNMLRATDGTAYDYAEQVNMAGASVDIPFIKRERQISLQIGYQMLDRKFIEESRDDYEGKTILAHNFHEGAEGAAWARLRYFNGTSFRRSNSIEDGRLVAVTGEKTSPELGGDISLNRTLGEWNEYLSNPWLKNHVLKLSACYGFGRGDLMAQGLFGLGGFGLPIVSLSPGLPRSIPLRGYEDNFLTGDRLIKLSCAYRFPVLDLSQGATGSMPVYYKQLFAEIFYEGGRAWDTEQDALHYPWLDSLGFELNFSLKLFRFLGIAPGLGFVYAPDQLNESDLDHSQDGNETNGDKRFQIYVSIKGLVNF